MRTLFNKMMCLILNIIIVGNHEVVVSQKRFFFFNEDPKLVLFACIHELVFVFECYMSD